MSEFIFFLIGIMLGGCIGIVIMCLLQINRLNEHFHRKEHDNEKEKYSEDCPLH